MMPKTYEELLAIVKAGTFQDIVSSGSPQLAQLLSIGAGAFERYPHDDQMKAMACMVGMICGTLYGESTAAGQQLGVMITHEHRLKMFATQAIVVFRESLKARGIEMTPKELIAFEPFYRPWDIPEVAPKKKVKKPTARILGIASGKRRKRPPADPLKPNANFKQVKDWVKGG